MPATDKRLSMGKLIKLDALVNEADEKKGFLESQGKMQKVIGKTKALAAFGGQSATEKAAGGLLKTHAAKTTLIGKRPQTTDTEWTRSVTQGTDTSGALFQMLEADSRLKELQKAKDLAREADEAFDRKKYEQALKLAGQALAMDATSVKALRVSCRVHIMKKLWPPALRETRELIHQEVPHEMDYTFRAQAKIGARDFNGAIADCGRALKINRLYVQAMYQRARANYFLFTNEGFDACIEECKECINIDSRDPYFWSLRAMAKQGLYDSSGAIFDCNEAIRIDYKHAPAWSTRGDARNDQEDHAGAIKDIRVALKLEKTEARVWSNGADALVNLEKYAESEKFGTESIDIDPHLYDGWGRRGQARFGLGNLKGAISDCEEAFRLNSLDKEARYCSSQAKFIRGNYKGSREDAEECLAVDPEFEGCDTVIHQTKEAERILTAWSTPPLIQEYRSKVASNLRDVMPTNASTRLVRVGSSVATFRSGASSPIMVDAPMRTRALVNTY